MDQAQGQGKGAAFQGQLEGFGEFLLVALPAGGADIGFLLPIPGFDVEFALEVFPEYGVDGVGAFGGFIHQEGVSFPLFFQVAQGGCVGAQVFGVAFGKLGEQGEAQAYAFFFFGQGKVELVDELVEDGFVPVGEQGQVGGLESAEVADAFADGKEFGVFQGFVGHGVVQVGDFPLAF